MVFQTLLKMIIDCRIHQTTENYEQVIGSHMLNTEDTAWCRNLLVKNYYAKGCS